MAPPLGGDFLLEELGRPAHTATTATTTVAPGIRLCPPWLTGTILLGSARWAQKLAEAGTGAQVTLTERDERYQLRFLTGPVGGRGCLPFLPCPPCLGTWLWALRERGPCARRLALLGLLALELLGLLLIFTPLVLLGLLLVLLDSSRR